MLDTEWLRSRIHDLTDRKLTVDVREARLDAVRLVVVRSPQALEFIRWKGCLRWRVDDRCVEVDATTWHTRRMVRERYAWFAQSPHVDARDARPAALEIARRHLRGSGESGPADLARASDQEMLRRLDVVDGEGYLTNAGALAFVGRGEPALDYLRRTVPAGDSRRRVHQSGLALLEEIDAVEHVGQNLTVTSPGGFVGGVTATNIITHPSQPRNRALAALFADLRIAEREGIGVDRMVREMIATGA